MKQKRKTRRLVVIVGRNTTMVSAFFMKIVILRICFQSKCDYLITTLNISAESETVDVSNLLESAF